MILTRFMNLTWIHENETIPKRVLDCFFSRVLGRRCLLQEKVSTVPQHSEQAN